MMKFVCKNNNFVFINIEDLRNYENLKDADYFLEIFSNDNLKKFVNSEGNNFLLKELDLSNFDWVEIISFIKNGVPMYYSLNVLNDLEKKDSFIFNLERLNISFNKLGGLKKFDEFYKKFNEDITHNNIIYNNTYNPQEPCKDYNCLYDWAIVHINSFANYNLGINKYSSNDGWSSCKPFIKKNELMCWYRKIKNPST